MIKIHDDIEQGSDAWLELRRGILTASEMKLIITPAKLEFAKNDKCRAHVYELLAQRITEHVEPQYISDGMMRGKMGEIEARAIYNDEIAPVTEVGFVTNDRYGFVLGYSPDGLVYGDGSIEIKDRVQKYQTQTIIDFVLPDEYALQIQTGLIVTERSWCDFISYHGGMPLFVHRVYPDKKLHEAILEACVQFEGLVAEMRKKYEENSRGLIMTERLIEQEINL